MSHLHVLLYGLDRVKGVWLIILEPCWYDKEIEMMAFLFILGLNHWRRGQGDLKPIQGKYYPNQMSGEEVKLQHPNPES